MSELWTQRWEMWSGYYVGLRSSWASLDVESITDKALCSPQPPWVRAVGFKALISHPGWRERERHELAWDYLLDMEDLHIIRLRRRNHVRAAVSHCIARETKHWVGQRTEEPVELSPDRVAHRVDSRLVRSKWMDNRLRGHPHVFDTTFTRLTGQFDEVSEVEDASKGSVMAEIQRFLSLPIRTLTTLTERQNPQPLSELVRNWEAVEKAVREVMA